MSLLAEIHEQPAVLQRSLQTNRDHVQTIARVLQQVPFALLAARGTSDNAARYAKYLWGAYNHLPVALATPSLFSLYGQPPRLAMETSGGALVAGISQSGRSPDIVGVVEEGNHQGCPTLAITNEPDSPLARAADSVILIGAGDEQAVAATKTYTAQLLAIAMLSVAGANDWERQAQLEKLPGWISQILALDEAIAQAALRYRYMQHCVVLGRGYNYATAFEWSLKLKELAYVVAEPYSSADFQHGPIAMIGGGFPAMAVAPSGVVFPDMLALLRRLKEKHRAELLVISDHPDALELATDPIPLPPNIPEWLTPLVSIVPAQLFCYHLTRVKGFDTETPRSLKKVTLTQ